MSKFRVIVRGEGTPLVLLNGMFQSAESWDAVTQSLSRFYKTVAMDLPNQGEAPTDDRYRTLRDYARFVSDRLDEAGIHIRDSIIFGYSFGSGVARAMLGEGDPQPRGLILGGALPGDMGGYLVRRMDNWIALLDKGLFDDFAHVMLSDIFSPYWLARNEAKYLEIFESFKRNYGARPRAARNLVASSRETLKAGSSIERFNSPWHMIAAKNDMIAPFEHVERFAKAAGARKLHVIPGGHTSRLEALPELIVALDDACRQLEQETS